MKKTTLLDWVGRTVIFVCLVFMIPQKSIVAAEVENDAQQRPLLVLVFDQNCKAWCAQVRPLVADLQKSYGEKVEFSEIDVTPETMAQSKKKAKDLRILRWLEDVQDLVQARLVNWTIRLKMDEQAGRLADETITVQTVPRASPKLDPELEQKLDPGPNPKTDPKTDPKTARPQGQRYFFRPENRMQARNKSLFKVLVFAILLI